MRSELFLLADKIKMLREKTDMTQAQLAKQLHLTRSSVNGWEMGFSVPSTQYIIDLARIFGVSTDYILGVEHGAVIEVDGLNDKEIAVIKDLIACFREKNSQQNSDN